MIGCVLSIKLRRKSAPCSRRRFAIRRQEHDKNNVAQLLASLAAIALEQDRLAEARSLTLSPLGDGGHGKARPVCQGSRMMEHIMHLLS